MKHSRTLFCLALTCGIAAASFAVKVLDTAVDAIAWPFLALALFVPLAMAFRDTWAGRAALDAFYALGAFVRRELSIERVRANAWLHPA